MKLGTLTIKDPHTTTTYEVHGSKPSSKTAELWRNGVKPTTPFITDFPIKRKHLLLGPNQSMEFKPCAE